MKILEYPTRVKIKGDWEPAYKGLTGKVGSYFYNGEWPDGDAFSDKQKKEFYYIVMLDKPFVFDGGTKWKVILVQENDVIALPKKRIK